MAGRTALYPIGAVSKRTGIGIDTLRAWERRYGAVTPKRDDAHRLYSNADVERLRLIHNAASTGHRVSRLARLTDAELRKLTLTDEAQAGQQPHAAPAPDASRFTAALTTLDTAAIDHELSRLAALLPPMDLIQQALLPALREAGENWNRRKGGIALEHALSATMRSLLGSCLRLYARHGSNARVLFATPAGDRHEIGILCAALLAATSGLSVTYLGPDLPAREIAEAVKATGARVLVLGLTLSRKDTSTAHELRALLRELPPRVEVWAGGAGARLQAAALGRRALLLADFDQYLAQLARFSGRRP